ncbi:MAG: hypothetical protein JWL71_803 [Acidobacteria bacterium]|nr:hypothetical protein [Acidobacteriota bacterium]
MHLSAEELVDIAEGTRADAAVPHLAACDTCRGQLHDMRAMMTATGSVDVPEPSPLFWDHLSSRVSEAVATASPDARLKCSRVRGSWTERLLATRAYAFITVAAAVLIAAAVSSRVQAPAPMFPAAIGVALPPPRAVADASTPADVFDDRAITDDPSLRLVASLTDGVDLDTAREAGLAPRGSAEHAVTHMTDAELRELRRLLTEELAKSGA